MSRHFHYFPGRREFVLLGRTYGLPQARWVRLVLGWSLVVLGLLGFLPVLGFWMIPLGLFILSHDIPAIRRLRRRLAVRLGRREGRGNGTSGR